MRSLRPPPLAGRRQAQGRALIAVLAVLVLTPLLLRPTPAIVQWARSSSSGQAHSTSSGQARSDSLQRVPNPSTALLLGIIPGGGQIYNGAWLKAALFIGAEGYYLTRYQQAKLAYDSYDGSDAIKIDGLLDARNGSAWGALLVYILGMLDAYVDAHLSTFPVDTSKTSLGAEVPTGEGPP